VVLPIGADQIGQHLRIPEVALGPGGGVPLGVPRDRQGIDREHLIAGCQQRLDPRAAVGLDPDHNLRRVVELAVILTDVLPDQLVQQRDPDDALGQSAANEPAAGLVLVSMS
jgi:hypothetical protein